ncbi:hypothetical protein C4580_04380 [Candidatus Woesearchaeota archaeon]|nr:MAG: hypothetical protein C4580_04380 [Candidatus Woesearchaeota archaeon]
MTKNLIITRPNHDVETSYLHSFSKPIIKKLKGNKDIHTSNLEGTKANRSEFEKALLKTQAALVFLNGHGNTQSVWGHNDQPLLDFDNVKLTKDKIIYALACDSLIELGEKSIRNGAKAYIGYGAAFMCVKDESRTSSPDIDMNAEPFRRACNTLIEALIEGTRVEKAVQLTRKEYIKSIKAYGTSEDDPYGDAPLIGFALTWNLDCLNHVGDGKAAF